MEAMEKIYTQADLDAAVRKAVSDSRKRRPNLAKEYLELIAQGKTLAEIGAQYGVAPTAIRGVLKRAGPPTCAHEYLSREHAAKATQ